MRFLNQAIIILSVVTFIISCSTKKEVATTPTPKPKEVSIYAIQFYVKYHPNGTKKKEYSTYKGKTNGKLESWFASGQREQLSHWKKGIQHGKTTFWYTNGNKRHSISHVNGAIQDSAYFYHFNGNLKSKGVFVDSKKERNWKFYDTSGVHYVTRVMKNDTKIDSILVN